MKHWEVDVYLRPGDAQTVAAERKEIEAHGFDIRGKKKFTTKERAERYAAAIKKVTGIEVEVYEVNT